MLEKEFVDKEEERLRLEVNGLSDELRKEFYIKINKKIKDPDTYAVLNWFFLAGLHHFYLEKFIRGIFNLLVFSIGVFLILLDFTNLGITFIIVILIIELWALFRSQIIVQDWNNKLYKDILDEVVKKV